MSAPYWLEALDQAGYRAMCYLLAALWQSSILLVATAGLAWLLRRRRAAARHALWMLALTVAPLLPLLTSAARHAGAPQAPLAVIPAYEAPAPAPLAPLGRPAIHESALPPSGPAPDPAVQPAPVQPPAHPPSFTDNPIRYPWSLALLAYAAGLIACLSLVAIGRLHIRQWVRSGRPAADERLERAFTRASAFLKLRGRFEVLICRRVPAPLSLGLRHPRILLPEGLITRLTGEELLAVALHELAHVRRRDSLLLTLSTLVRAVLFFHPLVWVAVRQASALAELCADDTVLEATGAPLPYAKMLARLAEELPPRPLSTEMATGLIFSKGAFLRRVEAILGDRTRIRRLSRLALWSTLAAVAISVCLAIVLPMDSKKAFRVSGDPLDVRLVGIAPDGEDLLFSPEGKPLGSWRAAGSGREVWSAEEFRRDYVFQLPQTSEPVTYLPPLICPVGSERFYPAQGFLGQTQRWEGGTTVSLCSSIVLDKRFHFPFDRSYSYGRHIPTHVDITFRFYQGRRGPATCRFTAPFAYDRVQRDPNQIDCELTIRKETGRGQRGEGLTFEIKAIMRDGREAARLVWEGLEAALFVYDRQGRAHWADYRGGGFRNHQEIQGKYFLKGIELEDVQSVAFNEQPRTKIFHNVIAIFPGAPERHHMAYLDVMAARLGLPAGDPESVRQYQFKSAQEAIRVLDCLRDYSRLYQVHNRFFISDLKPESFSREELEKLRAAAWEIVKSSDPSCRVFGAAIGLWGCWPEFAAPALEMVQGNDSNRDVVARALFLYREHLTDAQLGQVTEILLQRDDPRTSGELRTLLLRSAGRPSVVQALRRLAESDKPWLWMPALDGYQLDRLQKAGPLSEKIKLRLVATGLGAQIPDADQLAPQAYALLPPLLTPQFLQIDLSSFSQALKLVTQHPDRPVATALFVQFLERLLKEWNTWQVEGRSNQNWWAVDRIVKYLNLWHGTNLGGLGPDVSEETFNNSSYDWQAVARQAIEWARTGNDASQLPVAWSPKAGALRIVWRNLRDPELSVIGVWDPPLEPAESPAWTPLELAGDFLNYKIGRDDTAGSATLVFDTWAGVIKGHFVSSLIRFTPGQLPLEVTPPLTGAIGIDSSGNQHQTPLWRGSWEVWLEPAQSSQSVLVGSALFGLWSAKYLAGGPLGAPEPKVFARQPRDQVRRYVLERRSFEGWSEAEIALRHAMDQDAGFVSEDLRPFTEVLSRDGAARAWREFLGRADLAPEMKVFASWRVGSLSATNMGADDKPDSAAAESAFAQARAVDPELISNETINATTNWASLPGLPQDWARRLAEAHAWLTTRTDAMLERSARRPLIGNWPDLPPVRDMSKAPPEDIARAMKQLRAGLETGLTSFQANLPSRIEHIRREDPAAAQSLEETIRQASQPTFIKQDHVRDESNPPTENKDPLTTNTLAGLDATLELNKSSYDIGEPIIASLAIKNITGRKISLETGSDGRSGRAERFRFRVSDDKGRAVPDPLKIFVSSNLAGGLGSRVDLAPGETHTVSALLNLYASPRAPGLYTVSGDYQLIQSMDDATSGRLTLPPVTFRVGSGSSGMGQEQGRALFSKYKLDTIHPCVLYGLQDRTSRIPELIAMIEPKTTPPESPFAPPAERNAPFDAMKSLVLMPDKAALYRAIEKGIAARWPNSSARDDCLFRPLGHIYRTAITPESLPIIEPSLDHANASVADLAFLTALSMGSAKALDRLPAALRSTDSSKRQFARENAFQYLNRGLGSPGYAIEGIPTELVPKYGDALMEGFRQEEGDPARGDAEAFPDILPFGYLLEFHFAHYRLWEAIGIAVESNSPVKNMAALRYLAKCGENAVFPPLEKDQIARLIPFARRQMQTHPDARARALAMRCLGLWDDTESIPALTQALDAPEKPLRLAAAEALILLHHAPLLEKCIERLVEEDEAPDPKHMIWVAQRLGMKNAEQSLRLGLPGGVAATLPNNAKDSASDESTSRSIREMRERRKAVLRRLGGGAPAGAKPQTTLAGPEGIPLDVQRTIDRLASPDAKERAKAAAELGKMGGAAAKALPALLKAIFSDGMWNTMPKDAPFFPEDWAIKQIGRADPVALSDQIQNPDPKISSTVTSYLGEIGGPEAFQALLGAIHHKDSETRRTAIVALGRFKDVRAADSLLELLTSKEQMDRASAVLALDAIFVSRPHDQRQSPPLDPRVKQALLACLRDSSWDVRRYAAESLGPLGVQEAREPLLEMLNGDDGKNILASEAMRSLAQLGDRRATPLMLARLRSGRNIRIDVIQALGVMKDPQAVEPLIKLIREETAKATSNNGWTVGMAARALGHIGDPRAFDVLAQTLHHPDQSARRFAAQALVDLKDPRAFELLIDALDRDQDLLVRQDAATALGRLGDPRALDPLLMLLKSDQFGLRQGAAQGLGELKDSRAVGPLIDAIPALEMPQDEDVPWRHEYPNAAAEALKKITGQDFGEDAERWREWRKAHPDFKPAPRPDAETEKQVGRTQVDLNTLSIAMQAHLVDTNAYPKRLYQLTTPVAYLSALPEDPFATSDTQKLIKWKPDAKPSPLLYSIGPDRMDQGGAIVYDPTNGVTSPGDIVRTLKPGPAKSYKEIFGADLGKQIQQDAPIEDLIKALESDNINQWSRATTFLKLRGEKAKPAVPALIKALDRPQVRGSAMYALQGIGPAATEAIPAMIKLIEDQPEAQGSGEGPAQTLVSIGPAAVPALKEAARPVANPGDREIARRLWSCAALVKLGETDPAYLRYIGDVMQSKSRWISYKGLQAVQMVGPKAAALTPELKRMMTEPQFQQQESIKRAIITALLRIGPAASEALPEVISALDAKDSLARIEAIRAVRAINGEKAQAAIPQLIQALQANDKSDAFVSQQQPRVRAEAAETLRAMGLAARPAMPELIKLLDDPDEWARAKAVQAISNIDPTDPEALAGLIMTMRDPEGRVSRAANIALLKAGPVNIEVIRAFIRAVRENAGRFSISGDRTGFVSDIVIASEGFFGQLGPEHRYAVPDLADLARDPHPGVQRLAFQALANIGEVPADLMPTLIASAQENEGYWAAGVLRKMGPKAAPAAPAMLKILQTENDPRWITALDVLVAIGRPAADPAIPLIEQALKKYPIPPVQLCESLLSLDPGSQAALDGLEKFVANPPKGSIYDIPQAHALLLKHGRNAPEHLEALLKTMNGGDSRLSALAAKWIMESGQDARTRRPALDKIFAIQDDPAADDWAKAVASEGLRQIAPEEKDALPRLIGLIRGIKDQATQWQRLSAAVAGLGRFGPAAREALPDLNTLIQSKNRRVRDAAREAIKAIGPASSTPSGDPQQSDSSKGSEDVTREMERNSGTQSRDVIPISGIDLLSSSFPGVLPENARRPLLERP